jgi:hypothetical protein
MTTKSKKTQNERAIEAQAKQDKLAAELGISNDELTVVKSFVELLVNRFDGAATEPFVGSAETHIKKRMPNNNEAIEALGVDMIETRAQEWVEDNSIGRAIGGLTYPAPVDKAKQSVAGAARRLTASPGDEAAEVSYAKAVRWLAQMQCQAQYKEALAPIFAAVYRIHRGAFYAAPDQTESATTADESLNVLMG